MVTNINDTSGGNSGTSQNNKKADDSFTDVDIDNLSPEKVKEAYDSMLKDYRFKTEETANVRKQAEEREAEFINKQTQLEGKVVEWNNWYKETVEPHWADFEEYRASETKGTKLEINVDNGENAEDKIINKLQGEVESLRNNFAQKELEFRNYLNLNNQVFDLRMKHQNESDFDVNKVIEYAVSKQMPDLYRAYDEVYKDRELEKYAAGKIEEERKKWLVEQENEKLATVTGFSTPSRTFSSPKKSSRQDVLQSVLNDATKKYPGM